MALGGVTVSAAPVLVAAGGISLAIVIALGVAETFAFAFGRATLGLPLDQAGEPPRPLDRAIMVGTAISLVICMITNQWWIGVAYVAIVLIVIMNPELWGRRRDV